MKILKSAKIALVHEEREISYSELVNNISSLAKYLSLPKGTKVGILMENRPEWIYSFFAIWDCRATAVLIDYMSSKEDLEHVISHSDLSLILCSNKTQELVADKNILNVENLKLEIEESEDKDYNQHLSDLAVIIYTSGTSGQAEGVMLTRGNLLSNLEGITNILDWKKGNTIYTFAPMFHSAGLMALCFMAPSLELKNVLSDKISSDVIMGILQTYKVNILGIIPRFAYIIHSKLMEAVNKSFLGRTLFKISKFFKSKRLTRFLFKRIYKRFGGALEYIACGGASLDPKIQEDLKALSLEVYMSYGLTEASPVISYSTERFNKIGASGKVLANLELKLKDGEILVKGPNISQGYYKNPEMTAKIFKDGWLHTGDLGRVDKDGVLFIEGRKKEIIILDNGKNVWPQKIEDKMEKSSPIFQEVGLMYRDKKLTLLVKPDLDYAMQDKILNIEEFIKEKVNDYNTLSSSHEKIADVVLTKKELPRTRVGKLKRHLLEDFIAEKEILKDKMSGEEFAAIEEFFAKNFNVNISASSHIELDSSLDSLGKIQFIEFINTKFNLSLTLEDLAKKPIIKDLITFIKDQNTKVTKIVKDFNILRSNSMGLINFLTNIYLEIEVRNKENIPSKPSILVANHLSLIDWYVIAASLGKKAKNTLCLAKDKLLKGNIGKFISNRSNLLVFNLNTNLEATLEKVQQALNAGKNVVIFPEGTRSRDKIMLPFKKTFATIAKKTNVDVIPIRLDGTFEVFSPTDRFPKPGKVCVTYGKAISPDNEVDDIVFKAESSISTKID